MIKVSKYSEQIYVLRDRTRSNSILVLGKEKALLFDTGCGIDNLKETVESITSLPLLVIASHGHFDHVGGSHQFDCVYMSKEDRYMLDIYTDELLNDWFTVLSGSNEPMSFSYGNWKQIVDLDFDEFDLGDLKGEIIMMPGHSKGDIGIYFPKLKVLLAADGLSPVMCLMFPNHTSVQDQYDTIQRAKALDFDYFITTHSDTWYSKSILDRMEQCINNCKGKQYRKYDYKMPPYVNGYMYIDSKENEPVGIIVETMEMVDDFNFIR